MLGNERYHAFNPIMNAITLLRVCEKLHIGTGLFEHHAHLKILHLFRICKLH